METRALTLTGLPVVSRSTAPMTGKGFTLVELLIVITIIVVLMASMMPALDQAVYQAQLTVCGARLDAIAGAALTYAIDHKRAFPVRNYNMTNRDPKHLAGVDTWGASGTVGAYSD